MTRDRFTLVESIFGAALDRPREERDRYVREACAGDESLLREVRALLEADDSAHGFLDRPLVEHGVTRPGAGGTAPAGERRVGPYRLLRRIGEGGMSEVWLAVRDDDEYRKHVAVKFIRHDLDREDLLRRFRIERQILAGLDHPNIAKLLDGGSTEDGMPYFVMDYIEGEPIDEHCDRNGLTIADRLHMFRTVCSAVQYAHQNLVVHRDIKAGNILVTAGGVPKLLDFGIAKLLKPDQFAQQAEYTAAWIRPMTPRYASPEQIAGHPVGTPTDVYSLGVLLYKLLTGHLPYRLEGQPVTEVGRLIVEQEPERPSTAIDRETSARGDTSAEGAGQETAPFSSETISRARGTMPGQLRRLLSGDLDNIVLMALRKEPQRRYASVEQLSEDVRRHLEGLPVAARKDTFGYRAGKFLRRNRLAVGVAGAAVLMLAGFAVAMAVLASRIAEERDQVRRERDRAEEVIEFLEGIFEVPDPYTASGENISAMEILERGAQRVERELAGQPEVQSTLMEAIGNVYRNLGLFDRAEPLLRDSLATRRELLGEDHVETLTIMRSLGVMLRDWGRLDEADEILRETIGFEERHGLTGTIGHAETLNHLGVVLRRQGDFEGAEALYRKALGILERAGGRDRELSSTHNNLGAALLDKGLFSGAEQEFREALRLRRQVFGDLHPLVAQTASNLGVCIGVQGRYDEAEPFLSEAVATYEAVLPEGHPSFVEALNNLGKLRQRMGDLEESEQLYRRALAIERARLGDEHPNVSHVLSNIAELMQARGDFAGAEREAREAVRIREEVLGSDHADTGGARMRLASILLDAGRAPEAEAEVSKALAVFRTAVPPGHWRVAEATVQLGVVLGAQRRFAEAEPLLLEGLRLVEQARGPDHPRTRRALESAASFYDAWGRPEDAAGFRRRLAE